MENLHVHLENGQRVYFNEQNLQERLTNPPKSTLTAFFDLCKEDEFARTLLYSEVPEYYTWQNSERKFQRRKRGTDVDAYPGIKREHVIGRVYTVHPNNAECYFLRLLLHEVRGPTSFTYLKTVDSVLHPTYRAACIALGLLEHDAQWDQALSEAVNVNFPNKLRELFAMMLCHCNVSDPLSLWEKYKEHLSEGVKRDLEKQGHDIKSSVVVDRIHNKCLIKLEELIRNIGGKVLTDFNLPQSKSEPDQPVVANRELFREMSYDINELTEKVNKEKPQLNIDQKKVYDKALKSVDLKEGKMFFLDAPGGTGKTFLINLILAEIRMKGKVAIAVASSGFAATLLPGGRTAHSVFHGLPF